MGAGLPVIPVEVVSIGTGGDIGLDVALEALRVAYEKRLATPADIAKYAKIDRVHRVMQPYLEALS